MNESYPTTNLPTALHPWQQKPIISHSQQLLSSFHHWTGRKLIDINAPPEIIAQTLFEAPFVIVSHGAEPDPIFNYGNRVALELWELNWQTFTQTPSRRTAEPIEQAERTRLLKAAKEKGFIDNYQGIRISSTGRRFKIQNVVLWDVLDEAGRPIGQAATFDRWEFLE